jgi:4-hydroxybenzoate polyprenyltransferase
LIVVSSIFMLFIDEIIDFVPLYFLFLMGAWTARSAGCIINDYLDK